MGRRKLLLELWGKPLILWAIEPFLNLPDVNEIAIVVHHDDRDRCQELLEGQGDNVVIVTGGKERQDSVYEGLKILENREGIVLIQDGARPFVTLDMIHSVIGKASRDGVGVIPALPVKETIKRVVNGKVVETLQRKTIWSVQTPQAFPVEMLFRAYKNAMEDGFYSTDDAALCERVGYPVEVVEGHPENIKITTPDDLQRAELIIRSRGIEVNS